MATEKPSVRIEKVTAAIRGKASAVNPEEWLKKTGSGKWSATQCLEHLSRITDGYLPLLERAVSENYRPVFWERFSPFSKSIGNSMVATLGPEKPRPFKTPRLFQPSAHTDPQKVLDTFFEKQGILIDRMRLAESAEFAERIVTSPVSGLITFRVKDLADMLAGHQERHLAQAMYVLESGH